MEGHARTSGQIIGNLEVCGNTYTLRTPSVGVLLAGMEALIVQSRGNPFTMAARAVEELPGEMPPARRKLAEARIWQAAESASLAGGSATEAELTRFENSPQGAAYMFWACIREDHLEEIADPAAALELLCRHAEENGDQIWAELTGTTEAITGQAAAKNSSGPNRKGSGKRKTKRRKRR